MSRRKSEAPAAASSEVTSAGVPWSEVPDFALFHVEWMAGRHGSAKQTLPPVDRVAILRSYLLSQACTRTVHAERKP